MKPAQALTRSTNLWQSHSFGASKQRDKESGINGNNGYDYFGARYYDSRIGRWGGVEPKNRNLEQFSPYIYCGDNPLVLKDFDGRENIVVIGGMDITQDDPNKFMNSGIMAAKDIAGSDEITTIVVMTANTNSLNEEVLKQYASENINVVFANSTEELTNYINSGSVSNSELTEQRINDKITDMFVFAHGRVGSIEFAYDGISGFTDDEAKFYMGQSEVSNLKSGAFAQYSVIGLYSCNAATGKNSLAQILSQQTTGTVYGYAGLVSYNGIYQGASISNRALRKIGGGIGPAVNYPKADDINVESRTFIKGN